MSIKDAIKRIQAVPAKVTADETPKTWLDGSARVVGIRDSNGNPLDMERALADAGYYAANREAVLAERKRLQVERDEADRTAELEQLRKQRADEKARAAAEIELAQAEAQAKREEHEERVAEIIAAKAKS
jgi:hypothetical protein